MTTDQHWWAVTCANCATDFERCIPAGAILPALDFCTADCEEDYEARTSEAAS